MTLAREVEVAEPQDTVVDGGRIVIVDDDDLFRESVAQNLEDSGFSVEEFATGRDFLAYLAAGAEADLILLDWKMPEMNGIEVLRRLRADKISIPVLFLTVLSDQIYEEAALTSGAVDFVEKARSFSILKRRVELILGGSKGADKARGPAAGAHEGGDAQSGDILRNGHIELKVSSHRAYWKGDEVPLTVTEFKMVHTLVQRAGQDVRYRDLYDLVHGTGFVAGEGSDGYRANVRTFIKRIRQKFREIDDGFAQIENYPGFGYRWADAGRD